MDKFTIDNLIELYKKYKTKYGKSAYKYITQLLKEAKPIHKKYFSGKDHEQSWRSFKGKNFEKLIMFIIEDELKELGLKVIQGSKLENTKEENLSEELAKVKRNVIIDFGKFGYYMPDVDLIIYNPENWEVLAVLSVKVTLRERIAQSGYWKIKLKTQKLTESIKFFFITLDEDKTLTSLFPAKKGRAIIETELDGSYVLCEHQIEESEKVKLLTNL